MGTVEEGVFQEILRLWYLMENHRYSFHPETNYKASGAPGNA